MDPPARLPHASHQLGRACCVIDSDTPTLDDDVACDGRATNPYLVAAARHAVACANDGRTRLTSSGPGALQYVT